MVEGPSVEATDRACILKGFHFCFVSFHFISLIRLLLESVSVFVFFMYFASCILILVLYLRMLRDIVLFYHQTKTLYHRLLCHALVGPPLACIRIGGPTGNMHRFQSVSMIICLWLLHYIKYFHLR